MYRTALFLAFFKILIVWAELFVAPVEDSWWEMRTVFSKKKRNPKKQELNHIQFTLNAATMSFSYKDVNLLYHILWIAISIHFCFNELLHLRSKVDIVIIFFLFTFKMKCFTDNIWPQYCFVPSLFSGFVSVLNEKILWTAVQFIHCQVSTTPCMGGPCPISIQ